MLSSRDDALFILGFVLPCSAPGGSAVQITPMDFLEWKVQMRTLIMMNHVSVGFPQILDNPIGKAADLTVLYGGCVPFKTQL